MKKYELYRVFNRDEFGDKPEIYLGNVSYQTLPEEGQSISLDGKNSFLVEKVSQVIKKNFFNRDVSIPKVFISDN